MPIKLLSRSRMRGYSKNSRNHSSSKAATSEILGVIASSPTEIQPVMGTIAENAAKVCGANDAVMRTGRGKRPQSFGRTLRTRAECCGGKTHRPPIAWRPRRAGPGETIPDMGAVVQSEFPLSIDTYLRMGGGTMLDVPLMREAVSIGVIHIRRLILPSPEKQIKLLETFASQAVIAIENVRQRN